MIRAAQTRAVRKRYRQIAPVLNEQSRRRFAAMETRALGRGGVSLMACITGLAHSTIYHGLSDIRNNAAAAPGRIRRPGGGRKKKTSTDPTLLKDLKALVEPTTRGDPMRPLLWTCRSLRNLVRELAKQGHKVGVLILVQFDAHFQACFGGRGGDQLDNCPIGTQWLSAPIHRDKREETMLNLVPFARSWWEMANSYRYFELVCQFLQLNLPEAHAVSIATTPVGGDHQPLGPGVALLSHRRPPPANGVDSE